MVRSSDLLESFIRYACLFSVILLLGCTKRRENTHVEFSYDNTWTKSYSFLIDANDKVYLKIYFPFEEKGNYEINVSEGFIDNFRLKVAELKLNTSNARYYQPGLSDGTKFQIYKASKEDTLSVFVYGDKAPGKIYSIAFYLDSLIAHGITRKKTNTNFQVETGKNFELPVQVLKLNLPNN